LLQPASTLSLFLTLQEVSSVIAAYVIYFKLNHFKLSFQSHVDNQNDFCPFRTPLHVQLSKLLPPDHSLSLTRITWCL